MTFNSIRAGRGMSISVLVDGPPNLLAFDFATTLPINILIGIRISLKIKSNTTQFIDDDSNVIMDIFLSGV